MLAGKWMRCAAATHEKARASAGLFSPNRQSDHGTRAQSLPRSAVPSVPPTVRNVCAARCFWPARNWVMPRCSLASSGRFRPPLAMPCWISAMPLSCCPRPL
ncbi:MAG: hypothetical protein ACK55I_33670 [bacterium]